MEDTLEKRILKSNLSDEDKIEIIKRLSSNKEFIYVPQPVYTYKCRYDLSYDGGNGSPLNSHMKYEYEEAVQTDV